MDEKLVIETVERLLKKYDFVIRQICNNSDNTMEDLYQEAFCVVCENLDDIQKDDKVFANKMKSNCLKFNKYGKRIESSERWKVFNNREESIKFSQELVHILDEDAVCAIEDIRNLIGTDKLSFLIYYYSFGDNATSKMYSISKGAARKRASNLIKTIRKEMN